MRSRALVLAGLAILVAIGTATLAQRWVAAQRAALARMQAQPPKPPVEVLVAAKDLPTGSFVRAEDMRWQAWPDGALVETYLRRDRDQSQPFVGAVVRLRVTAGEPITDARLIKPGDRGFLAAVLNPGMRAVSIPVTATSGVAGLVFPGDRVDLILSHQIKDPKDKEAPGRNASETIMSDVRVLAVDQTTNDRDNKPSVAKTVTFEVQPKQVEAIEVAGNLGKISLSLRSLATDGVEPSDRLVSAAAETTSHTWDTDVSPLLPKRPPPAERKAPPTITVLRGDSKSSGSRREAVSGGGGGSAGLAGSAEGIAQAAQALTLTVTPVLGGQ